jgi:hypothetical protein
MHNEIKIKEIKKNLSDKEFEFLTNLIRKENPDSILSSLSRKTLAKYFNILIKSQNIFLYFCEINKTNVGYMIICNSPLFLISEFKELRLSILVNLISNLKLKALLNIFISLIKLDIILLLNKRNIINNNPNLFLLAINKDYQSKGIGQLFVEKVINDFDFKKKFNKMTVETNNSKSENFFKYKLNFDYLGYKLRFFKNLKVSFKKLK